MLAPSLDGATGYGAHASQGGSVGHGLAEDLTIMNAASAPWSLAETPRV